jgi:hypothetical protein
MTLWDLRQWIESRIPLWAYAVILLLALGYLAWLWYHGQRR